MSGDRADKPGSDAYDMDEDEHAYRIESDARENRESALPDGETVRVVSLTCTELYTPSTVAALLQNIERLGWVHDDRHEPPFANLATWVRSARSSSSGGSWANMGTISDLGQPRRIGGGLRAPLPPGVESIIASIHSETPSITAVVLQFVFDDAQSLALNGVFDGDLTTRTDRRPNGWAFVGPSNLRTERVVAVRREQRALCHDWIASNLPGAFASGLSDHGIPTIETFTCDLAKPFEERGTPDAGWDYLQVLNIAYDHYAYESPNLKGWRLEMWGARSSDEPFVVRLGARWDDVTNDIAMYGGQTRHALALSLSHSLESFAPRFALDCLLGGYEEHLARIRDRVTVSRVRSGRVADRDVDDIYQLVTDESYDARVVAGEIAELCSSRARYMHAVDFAPVRNFMLREGETLLGALRRSDRSRAKNVVAAEAIARDMVANTAAVLTSKVNLRLSRAVFWLTCIATVASIVALALAL